MYVNVSSMDNLSEWSLKLDKISKEDISITSMRGRLEASYFLEGNVLFHQIVKPLKQGVLKSACVQVFGPNVAVVPIRIFLSFISISHISNTTSLGASRKVNSYIVVLVIYA